MPRRWPEITDLDVPLDPSDLAPDVTTTNESAADLTARIAAENGGATSTAYTVQPGRRLDRDGVILEAGTVVQFRADEIANGVPAARVADGTIA